MGLGRFDSFTAHHDEMLFTYIFAVLKEHLPLLTLIQTSNLTEKKEPPPKALI